MSAVRDLCRDLSTNYSMIPTTEVGKTNGGAASGQTTSCLRHTCWLGMEVLPSGATESSGPQTAAFRRLWSGISHQQGWDYKEAVPGKRGSVLGSALARNAVISRLCGLCRLAGLFGGRSARFHMCCLSAPPSQLASLPEDQLRSGD